MATKREKLLDYFDRRNISCSPDHFSKNFLISDEVSKILKNIAFSEGYYTIQDTSAGLIVEMLNPEENEAVLDLFAAPGGKATYIAELMNNTGEVVAVDKYPNKVKKIKKAIERLQLKNIKLITEDAFRYGPVAPAFDKVLLDVPCSGWGVFQKKPELRWQKIQNIPQLLKLQEKALKIGSSFVKEGGYLVYSTCTLNREENEKQIEKFLEKNQNFRKVTEHKNIPAELIENGYLQALPFKHEIDGAFAAKLQKVR
jgi:16S rRNA (cytosine967-C5)-methyltransferase